jgi:hypothetical protein
MSATSAAGHREAVSEAVAALLHVGQVEPRMALEIATEAMLIAAAIYGSSELLARGRVAPADVEHLVGQFRHQVEMRLTVGPNDRTN